MFAVYFAQFVNIIGNLLIFLVFVRALLSWFPRAPHNWLIHFIHEVTEPLFGLVRRLIPSAAQYGLSPIVIMLGLELTQKILLGLLGYASL